MREDAVENVEAVIVVVVLSCAGDLDETVARGHRREVSDRVSPLSHSVNLTVARVLALIMRWYPKTKSALEHSHQ